MGVLGTIIVIIIFVVLVVVFGAVGYSYYQGTLKEVYVYNPGKNKVKNWNKANKYAEDQKGVIADTTQLTCAFNAGAQWCVAGWLADGINGPNSTSDNVYYPMQEAISGCGGERGIIEGSVGTYGGDVGVLVYGVKPKKGTVGVSSFNGEMWSMWKYRLQDLF